MPKKPITTTVTISRLGVYDAKRKVFFWAEWMRRQHNRKVYVVSDLFSTERVHINAADTDQYLGMATTKSSKPLITIRVPTNPNLLSFCNSAKGEAYAN